ncbi:MAG TPA: pectinesterase family protein [Puia sp.]|nr:pectinesterase family protein [Puia sp.]
MAIRCLIPALLLIAFLPREKKIRIWLIGDSTMANKEAKAYPETGWGMPFAGFFDSNVSVDNRARNGRSTKSFLAEGLWQPVLDSMQPGDYVLIQFGHNDEGKEKTGRYTTPGEFKANLLRYVTDARRKGAIPVLITPVARRSFDSAGEPRESHPGYADAVREVAAVNQVPLIDLDERSQVLLHQFGPGHSEELYNYLAPEEHPNYPEGHSDDTHFSELGARKVAELVLVAVRDLFPGLAEHIRPPFAGRKLPPDRRKSLVVAADGSGDYRTVQAALDAVPPGNDREMVIYIRKGVYVEKLHLDSTRPHVTLVGEDADSTILSYHDHPGLLLPNGDSVKTRNSRSFLVQAADFSARRITFRNDAGPAAGQAVALEVQGDRASFFDCRIVGNQDVLFLNSRNKRQYFRGCYIEGTTDFIFGGGRAWFEDCRIRSKKNSYVTAASTGQDSPYGFIFYHCVLTGDSSVTRASLGRPWRPFASVDYIHCYIGAHIRPEGWSAWNNSGSYRKSRFAEYDNYGPGAERGSRVSWSQQLNGETAARITFKNVYDDWYPEICYY